MKSSISNQLLSEFSELVASLIGLHFPRERWPDLARGADAAAREFGFGDVDTCLHWLLNRSLEKSHIEILASYLTIGETYFFRDEKQFEILEQHVLPELIRARRPAAAGQLRIWCAGCATGEEPYSVAIALHRLIPDISNWSVTILATDINPHFLRKARNGVYRDWSFRSTPAWIRERYFRKRNEGLFEVLPEIRKSVTFSYDNLAEDPSIQMRTRTMDLILCRNVLMYFAPTQARRIADRFWQSLTDRGWLAVSPSEASQDLFSPWVPVNFPGIILYKRDSRTPVSVEPLGVPAEVYPDANQIGDSRIGFAKRPAEPSLTATEEKSAPKDVPSLALLARIYANEGKLAEALERCEKAIAVHKLNPGLYYLLATILEESGQVEEAVVALKRALYLDHDFVLAHFSLGHLMARQGRIEKSGKHFRNVLSLLNAYRPEEIVPESEGMTAGALMEIVKRQAAWTLEKGL